MKTRIRILSLLLALLLMFPLILRGTVLATDGGGSESTSSNNPKHGK